MNFRVALLLIPFLVSNSVVVWQASESLQKPVSDPSNKNVESFEVIWQTIKESHWDASRVGESWDRHRATLLPKVRAAESIGAAREIFSTLLGELGQSHFGIVPADSYDVLEGSSGGRYNTGITVRLVENQLVVSAVRPGSSAEKSGVRPAWVIKKIRNRSAVSLIEKFESAAHGPQRIETVVTLAMPRLMSGDSGDRLPIQFLDANNQLRGVQLAVEKPPGKYSKFGNLPPILVDSETRTLRPGIGYFRFNAFLDALTIMPGFQRAVRDKNHARGLVIDLRGNIGGLAAMTMGMAGEFVTQAEQLGTMTMRGQELNFIANPRPTVYQGTVAVLVDEGSISSAEFLAGGLQDLHLARIFGARTAGLALPSVVVKLPNGDGFQYAIADYHSVSGKSLEKDGVIPDQEIVLTRELLRQQDDPVLAAALAWIEKTTQQ